MSASPVPLAAPLVIVGCSRRKRPTPTPIPALELYEGGCIPQLRRRLGDRRAFRDRVRILSAEHGLITADRPVLPYDRVLTDQRAIELRPEVTAVLRGEIETAGLPHAVLLAAGPRYQALVTGLLTTHFRCPDLRTVGDVHDWAAIAAVLDSWGWP